MSDYIPIDPKPVLKDDVLYFGDNGRCFCGKHAGASARYSGRTISGHRVHRVNDRDREEWRREVGYLPACETCRSDAQTQR